MRIRKATGKVIEKHLTNLFGKLLTETFWNRVWVFNRAHLAYCITLAEGTWGKTIRANLSDIL